MERTRIVKEQDIALIRDKHGSFAIVDADLFDELNQFSWHQTSQGYFARRTRDDNQDLIYLHRQVNNTPKGMHTDHSNGLKYDCTRSNLRTSSKCQNMCQNSKKRKDAFYSIYKGVSRVLTTRKIIRPWRAQIRTNGKQFHLGVFFTEKEAALAYNAAAVHHFGEFAKLNEV